MTEQVYNAILEIIEAKRAAKRWPQIALFRELFDRFGSDVKPSLRALIDAKRIRFGRCVNDWYFELI